MAQTKDASDASTDASGAAYQKVVSNVMFAGVVSTTMLMNARPSLLADLTSGQGGDAAALLGRMGSAGALAEFLTGPAIGRA